MNDNRMGPVDKSAARRKNRIFFLAVVVCISLFIISIFFWNRNEPENVAEESVNLPSGVGLYVDRFTQTATKDGKREWKIEAESARYENTGKRIVFRKLKVLFFPDGENPIRLTAKHGVLETETNDMEVSDDVVISGNMYRFQTEKVSYRQKEKILHADTPVKLFGKSVEIIADTMTVELTNRRSIFIGSVRGVLDAEMPL